MTRSSDLTSGQGAIYKTEASLAFLKLSKPQSSYLLEVSPNCEFYLIRAVECPSSAESSWRNDFCFEMTDSVSELGSDHKQPIRSHHQDLLTNERPLLTQSRSWGVKVRAGWLSGHQTSPPDGSNPRQTCISYKVSEGL